MIKTCSRITIIALIVFFAGISLWMNTEFSTAAENSNVNTPTKITIQSKDMRPEMPVEDWYATTWNGKRKKPEVKVFADQIQLVKNRDYMVRYGNNRDMGCCRVFITGKGDYKNEDICGDIIDQYADLMTEENYLLYMEDKYPRFIIRPIGTKLNKVKGKKKSAAITWKKQSKRMSVKHVTGYNIQVADNKDFKGKFKTPNVDGKNKTIWVKGYKRTSIKIKGLEAKKKYYVRIRTYFSTKTGFKVYSTWSKVKAVRTK